ncbi:MAG: hypothetical protein IPK19_23350 [Chloroflexi bacterium]|nr:hypothetical protein [Chloroflexota bacterium]
MRIAIIRTYSIKSHMISHPLRVFGRLLAEHDLRLSFFSRVDDPRIADHDAVLILESDIRSTLPEGRCTREGEIELVTGYRERGQAVVWFDESASSAAWSATICSPMSIYTSRLSS